MDDEQPDNQTTPPQSPGSTPVNIPVNGASSPVNEPSAITPPTPGQVVSAGSARPPAVPTVSAPPSPSAPPEGVSLPPAQVVTSNHGGGKKRWLKAILLIIIIGLLAAGGWLAYQKHHTVKAPAVTHSRDIPLINIGLLEADFGELYPKMNLNEYNYLTNAQMFEGLVRYEDKSKIVPDLASTWTNPDATTWLFTIKSGVKFHDGHTLAATDVKYSLDQIMSNGSSEFNQTFANTIKSVEVVGSNQVKITTTVPDPVLLNRLAFLYIIDANLPKGDEPSQAGTGPYEIKPGTQPTGGHVQMVAFNDYHGGQPTTKALDFSSLDNSAGLLDGLKTGKYNIVGANLEVTNPQDVKDAKKYIVDESNVAYIAFNTLKPGPLQNKSVREAIRYALDPLAISKADSTSATALSQLIPRSIPGYNPAIAPYKQNIAKAKQLLAQAGYPNGLTIRYSTAADGAKSTEIINQLKQAGITATLDRHEDFDEFIKYYTAGSADMYDIGYSSDTLDGLDIYQANLIAANYNNPKATALLDQAATTADQSKRLKLLQDVATIVDQDIPVVPLYSQEDVYWVDKDYVIRQDMPSALLSAYFYKVHQK